MGGRCLKELAQEKVTIILEQTNDYVSKHPFFRMHDVVVREKQKKKQNTIEQEISHINEHKQNSILIYLYKKSEKKKQMLLKIRNFYLPETILIPMELPKNDAETIHLLFLLTNNLHEPYIKLLEKWHALKKLIQNFTVSHQKYKKIQQLQKRGKVLAISNNIAYILWRQEKEKVKKIGKGNIQELLGKLKLEFTNSSAIVIQEMMNGKRYFYHSIDKLENLEETAFIYVSLVRHIGVMKDG